jgi:hypothetical protein
MNSLEISADRPELATRDRLVRRLMGDGWDVWTEFCYEANAANVIFDVLARRNGEVRVYEIVPKHMKRAKQQSLTQTRKIATENGWDFQLEEAVNEPSSQQLSDLRVQLAAVEQATEEVATAEGPAQIAFCVYALMVADQALTMLLDLVALKNGWPDHELHAVARKLIDLSKLTDKEFTYLSRIRMLRNQAAHAPLTVRPTPLEIVEIGRFIQSLAVKLVPQMA